MEEEALSRVPFVVEGDATLDFRVTSKNLGESLKVVFSHSTPRIPSDHSFQAWGQGFNH